ncbi:MAG: hypothetical protein ONB24_05670 [candidate division KSB1 bacterium]|nr:hypothetical protein [candidate division KSB1 bacterium]
MKTRLLFLSLFGLFLITHTELWGQTQKKAREDGDPIFNNWLTGWDPTIRLSEDRGVLELTSSSDDTLLSFTENPWKLSGILWEYNNAQFTPQQSGRLLHAVDVDDISSIWGEPVYLITDQSGNKVIIYSLRSNSVVWEYPAPDANYSSPTDAFFYQELVGGTQVRYALITWKGSNVVAKVSMGKNIVWRFGRVSTAGMGDGLLNSPSDAVKILGTPEVLIADTGNKRVIIVDERLDPLSDPIMWSYSGPDGRFSPVDVEYIDDAILGRQVLITDQTAHRVLLVNRNDQTITWAFGDGTPGDDASHLRNPADADWNPATRRVVIADKGNNRIIEVSPEDPTYFYQWPNPAPSVDDADPLLSGGFLLCRQITLDGLTVWTPAVFEFDKEAVEFRSPVIDLIKDVDFETIRFAGENLNAETSVRLQFRSSSTFPNEGLAWRGPDGTPNTFYTAVDSVLFAEHKLHRYFQVRAFLSTTNPRVTPVVNQVRVSYRYYDTTLRPHIFTRDNPLYPIGAARENQAVHVSWDSLTLVWKPYEEERLFLSNVAFTVSLTNPDYPDRTLLNLGPLQVSFEPIRIPLGQFEQLFGARRLTMVITLITYNSAMTPRLDKWRIAWRETPIEPPALAFVDAQGNPKDFYTAATYIPAPNDSVFADQAFVQLKNIIEPGATFNIEVTSNLSLDAERITVKRDTLNLRYTAPAGIPLRIVTASQAVTINNDTLEIFDRDVLAASFRSALRPNEVLSDSIPVIQGMLGNLIVTNAQGQEITASPLNQPIFARVVNELDRSIDVIARDSLQVMFLNPSTNDREYLTLYEEQGQNGQYHTGRFSSQNSITLRNALNYTPGDRFLYARPNDDIQVIYFDNFKKPEYPTRRFISVPDTISAQMAQPLYCKVAPNPYIVAENRPFRMRLGSSNGTLTIRRMEIFNLAGEKVAEIDPQTIRFESGGNSLPPNQFGHINNWWNLLTDGGRPAASGTYWVKVQADILSQTKRETLSALVKFVIIR